MALGMVLPIFKQKNNHKNKQNAIIFPHRNQRSNSVNGVLPDESTSLSSRRGPG